MSWKFIPVEEAFEKWRGEPRRLSSSWAIPTALIANPLLPLASVVEDCEIKLGH